METTVKYNVNSNNVNVNNSNELASLAIAGIEKIKTYAADNGYKISNQFDATAYSQEKMVAAIKELTRKRRKVLRNYIEAIGKHITISKANKFLHLIYKTILKSDVRIKISVSDKEAAIQVKRAAYKNAIALARKAQEEYKTEKGDFYKTKLN